MGDKMTTFMMQLITGIVWLVILIVGWRQHRFNWLGYVLLIALAGVMHGLAPRLPESWMTWWTILFIVLNLLIFLAFKKKDN